MDSWGWGKCIFYLIETWESKAIDLLHKNVVS